MNQKPSLGIVYPVFLLRSQMLVDSNGGHATFRHVFRPVGTNLKGLPFQFKQQSHYTAFGGHRTIYQHHHGFISKYLSVKQHK